MAFSPQWKFACHKQSILEKTAGKRNRQAWKINGDHSLNSMAGRLPGIPAFLLTSTGDLPWRTHPSTKPWFPNSCSSNPGDHRPSLFRTMTELPDFPPRRGGRGGGSGLRGRLGYYPARNRISSKKSSAADEPRRRRIWQALPGIGPHMAAAVTAFPSHTRGVSDGNASGRHPHFQSSEIFRMEPPPKRIVRSPRPCSSIARRFQS